MKKLLFIFSAIIISITYSLSVYAAGPELDAGAYILVDAKSGQVICEKNSQERKFPASTTKIMAAIVALEKGKPEQLMKVSQYAIDNIGDGGANADLRNGEQLKMEDILNALLIRSANETAYVLAENLYPDPQMFIDRMNERARELGAMNTHFQNPCGMHDDNHYSTAADLAVMARHAMTFPKFREIVLKKFCILPPTPEHPEGQKYSATNEMLYSKSDYYDVVTGIKTGYTSQAGNNLISSAINGQGMELIAVVLDVRTPGTRDMISKELLEYGFKTFSLQNVIDSDKIIQHLEVADANDTLGVDALTGNSLLSALPKDTTLWNIEQIPHLESNLKAPISKGQKIGYLEFKREGAVLGNVDLIASRSVEKNIKLVTINKIKQFMPWSILVKTLLIIVCIIVVFFLMRFALRKVSRSINSKN